MERQGGAMPWPPEPNRRPVSGRQVRPARGTPEATARNTEANALAQAEGRPTAVDGFDTDTIRAKNAGEVFMIRFACLKCKKALQAHPEQAGAAVACPRCRAQMRVRAVARVAKVGPQPAGPTPDGQRD